MSSGRQKVADARTCPVCGRTVRVEDGAFSYHDRCPPLRALCPASQATVLGIDAAHAAGKADGTRSEREACVGAVRALGSSQHTDEASARGYDLGLCAAEAAIRARAESEDTNGR